MNQHLEVWFSTENQPGVLDRNLGRISMLEVLVLPQNWITSVQMGFSQFNKLKFFILMIVVIFLASNKFQFQLVALYYYDNCRSKCISKYLAVSDWSRTTLFSDAAGRLSSKGESLCNNLISLPLICFFLSQASMLKKLCWRTRGKIAGSSWTDRTAISSSAYK